MARININQSKIVKSFPSYWNSKLVPEGIVIHDTAGQSSAVSEANRLQSTSQYNNGIAHFYIDDKECYQLVLANVKAWHCGDGANQPGNGTMLGIEVCKSLPSGNFTSNAQKETYKKSLDRAYQLAADLCEEWNIDPSNIHQHREFSSTSCPYTEKVLYGSYEKALNEAKNKVNYYFDGGSYYENDSQNNEQKGDGYMLTGNTYLISGGAFLGSTYLGYNTPGGTQNIQFECDGGQYWADGVQFNGSESWLALVDDKYRLFFIPKSDVAKITYKSEHKY